MSSSGAATAEKERSPYEICKGINGLEKIILRDIRGSSVEIYLYGAHITSWKTEHRVELLFVSNKFLSDKDPGESIVPPSSRGPSFLTLTFKVYDDVYAHKDIIEGGKEHKDITSLLRIGKTLKIGEDTFEDLDEVMDRYVDPLVAHLKAMLNYRKFQRGNESELDELLRIEKAKNPMRIVYGFGICHEHPGTFILTYIRCSNPHHEYIGLYPKGFKFRKRIFEDIDRLVAYFQRHIDDPHDSTPSIRNEDIDLG